MFTVNNKNTRATSLFPLNLWFSTYFTHFSSVSILDYEQVNVSMLAGMTAIGFEATYCASFEKRSSLTFRQ